jgi:hypothetical protein
MAKQDGIIPLKGTIDNITFSKTKDGYQARKKIDVVKGRMAGEGYDRVRETMALFTSAANAAKLIRVPLRPIAKNASDGRVTSRLSKRMQAVIKADVTNPRGKKNVLDGETELLTGFDFNLKGKLSSTFFPTYEATIDRLTGTVMVKLPAFVPKTMIASPAEATHYQLNIAGLEVDFEQGTNIVQFKSSEQLPMAEKEQAAFELSVTLTPNSTHPLFLVLGINFFIEDVDGNKALKNKAFNALAIVKVSGV